MKKRQVPILPSALTAKESVVLPVAKPRNPLVPAARQRKAGAHEVSTGGKRQMQQRELARQLWQSD